MMSLLNTIADKWFTWQISMLWQTAVLIAIIWIADLLIRKWAWPQVRYALWMLVLVKLLIPPTFTSPASVTSHIPAAAQKVVQIQFNPAPQTPETKARSASAGIDVHEGQNTIAAAAPETTDADSIRAANVRERSDNSPPVKGQYSEGRRGFISWKVYAMFVWLAGITVLSMWLIARLSGLRKEHLSVIPAQAGIQRQPKQLPERFSEQLEAVAQKLNLKRLPQVILTDKVSCPAVFGVFRPVLLMPAKKFERMSKQDTEHILLHELAHIKRGDLLVHAVYMILQIAYWFNPLLWMIRKTLQNLRELCCDATVSKLLRENTIHYRQTLLETARRLLAEPVDPGLGLLGLFENSRWLVARLKWLEKNTWKNRPLRIATIIILVAIMTTCVMPMANRPKRDNIDGITTPASVQWIELIQTEDSANFHIRIDRCQNQRFLLYHYHAKFIQEDNGGVERKTGVSGPSRSNFDNGKVDIIGKIYRQGSRWKEEYAIYDPAHKKKAIETSKGTFRLTPEDTTRLIFFKDLKEIGSSPNRLFELQVLRDNSIIQRYGFIGEINQKEDIGDDGVIKLHKEYVKKLFSSEAGQPKVDGGDFTITGTVTDTETGKPIAGAKVGDNKEYDDGKFSTVTDSSGHYEYKTWYEEHFVVAEADGYKTESEILLTKLFGSEEEKIINFELTKNSKLKTESFTTILPDGEAVKLVALFRPNDNPIVFWDPDGGIIEGPKLKQFQLDNAKIYELAYVLQRPEMKIKDGYEHPAPDGNFYDVHGWKTFQLESGQPFIVKRAWGYGAWADVGTIKEGQDFGNYNLTIQHEVPKGPLKQVVARMFWEFDPDFGIRLVAVDKKGNEYPVDASDEFIGDFRKDQRVLYAGAAMGLNKKELSHFKLQRRPLFWATFEGFALGPKESTQNSELKTPNYKATLPNGVTVELLGVYDFSDPSRCWNAKGVLLDEMLPFFEQERKYACAEGQAGYEFLVRFNGLEETRAVHTRMAAMPNPRIYSAQMQHFEPGQETVNLCSLWMVLDQSLMTCDLDVAVAGGEWKTVATAKQGNSLLMDNADGFNEPITISPIAERDGRTVVSVSHSMTDQDVRLIAIDTDGKEYPHPFQEGSVPGSFSRNFEDGVSTSYQFNLPLEKLDSVKLQTRPYSRITFKNVALRPGVKTQVEVSIDDEQSANDKSAEGDSQTAIKTLEAIGNMSESMLHAPLLFDDCEGALMMIDQMLAFAPVVLKSTKNTSFEPQAGAVLTQLKDVKKLIEEGRFEVALESILALKCSTEELRNQMEVSSASDPIGMSSVTSRQTSEEEVKEGKVILTDGRMNISFDGDNPRVKALQILGKMYQKNIVPSEMTGGINQVTNLYDVTFEEALKAVCGTDHTYVVKDKFIYVYTYDEYDALHPAVKTEVEIEQAKGNGQKAEEAESSVSSSPSSGKEDFAHKLKPYLGTWETGEIKGQNNSKVKTALLTIRPDGTVASEGMDSEGQYHTGVTKCVFEKDKLVFVGNEWADVSLENGRLIIISDNTKLIYEKKNGPGGKTEVEIAPTVQVEDISLPVRFIASDNDGRVERYHWRLNLTKPVRLARTSFKIEGDSIRGYWGSTDGTLTNPADGPNVDYQLIISKEGDELDYLMRNSQSHEGLNGYDGAASSSKKQIALPECDQIRTYVLKEPVGLSEKYLPLWRRDFIKDGNVIRTLMYAVRIAGEKDENPFVPTMKDIADNTNAMVEIETEKSDLQAHVASARKLKELALACRLYADDNNAMLPPDLDVLKPYLEPDLFIWVNEHVVYLPKGNLKAIERPDYAAIAYDKQMLDSVVDRGQARTNVVFADGHDEMMVTPDQLEKEFGVSLRLGVKSIGEK